MIERCYSPALIGWQQKTKRVADTRVRTGAIRKAYQVEPKANIVPLGTMSAGMIGVWCIGQLLSVADVFDIYTSFRPCCPRVACNNCGS